MAEQQEEALPCSPWHVAALTLLMFGLVICGCMILAAPIVTLVTAVRSLENTHCPDYAKGRCLTSCGCVWCNGACFTSETLFPLNWCPQNFEPLIKTLPCERDWTDAITLWELLGAGALLILLGSGCLWVILYGQELIQFVRIRSIFDYFLMDEEGGTPIAPTTNQFVSE